MSKPLVPNDDEEFALARLVALAGLDAANGRSGFHDITAEPWFPKVKPAVVTRLIKRRWASKGSAGCRITKLGRKALERARVTQRAAEESR